MTARTLRPAADLFEALPTGLTIHVDNQVEYANATLLRLVGAASMEEVLGRSILDFIRPDFHEITRQRVRTVYGKGSPPEPIDIVFLRLDGSPVDVEISAAAIDWEGRPASLVVVSDTTRRHRAERAQLESEERYRRLLEQLPIGVVVHAGGRFVFVNPAAARLVGAASAGVPGAGNNDPSVVARFPESHHAAIEERIRRVYAREEPPNPVDARLVRLDGSTIDVELSSVPVEWEGQPAAQVLVTDIGPRRTAEAERLDLERRLWQAQQLESLALLAGGVAHDFNNLLVGILGNADLACEEVPEGTSVRACLDGIVSAARLAADLARRMLAYAGCGPVVEGSVDLDALARETSDLLGSVLSSRVAVVHRPSQVPPVRGDATQLRQVVMNLLTNASEALQPGGGTITISTGTLRSDGRDPPDAWITGVPSAGSYAWLDVSDDGPGISPEVRARIFDLFFSTKGTGRGLGLASVLGIVRAHRGAIRLDCRPGLGSAFRILLPIPGDAVTEGTGSPARTPDSSGSPVPSADAPALAGEVLVADDEALVRDVVRRMLEQAGFSVRTASDGQEAVDAIARSPDRFRLALIDRTMPRLDGLETLARVRGIRPDLPVILYSGFVDRVVAPGDLPGPEPVHLHKPFTAGELMEAVRRTLA